MFWSGAFPNDGDNDGIKLGVAMPTLPPISLNVSFRGVIVSFEQLLAPPLPLPVFIDAP